MPRRARDTNQASGRNKASGGSIPTRRVGFSLPERLRSGRIPAGPSLPFGRGSPAGRLKLRPTRLGKDGALLRLRSRSALLAHLAGPGKLRGGAEVAGEQLGVI